jgi:glycosyltransferase involved in cell wall biosynthesis
MRVIAVMPAYNESATIGDVIHRLREVVSDVVVVDDYSKDSTSDVAKNAGAIVVRHEKNTGYDGALDDGFAEAARHGADVIVTCDADGQHRVEDLIAVVQPILDGKADVSIGQRASISRFGEKVFAIYTRLRFGIRDPLCGLKAYRREVFDAVGYFDTLKSIGTQLMVEAWLRRFRLVTVPIVVLPRKDESRFYAKLFRANMRIIAAASRIVRLSFNKRTQRI